MISLKKILSEELLIAREEISLQSDYRSLPGWTSLKHVQIILHIEKETKVRMTPREISKMVSVKGIVDVLKSKGVSLSDF